LARSRACGAMIDSGDFQRLTGNLAASEIRIPARAENS
jgi:hypothetical protein